MSEPKQYVPGMFIRSRTTQFGEMLNVSMDATKIAEWLTKNKDERGFVKITIAKRREAKDDLTHNAWLDTWKPTGGARTNPPTNQPANTSQPDPSDFPPF